MAWQIVNPELYKNDKGTLLKKFAQNDWRIIDNDNFNLQIPLNDLFFNPVMSIPDIVSGLTINSFEVELLDGQNSLPLPLANVSKLTLFLEGVKVLEELYSYDKESGVINLKFTGSEGEKLYCLCY